MARYILIDNNSGFIFGDTADMPRVAISTSMGMPMEQNSAEPIEAARWLDEAVIGEHGRSYEMTTTWARSTETGYFVYRADINGSEAVPAVEDGQDQATIEAVKRDCKLIGFIRCLAPAVPAGWDFVEA